MPAIETYQQISQDSLLEKLKEKDQKGINYFYDAYSSAIFGIVSKISPSEEIAEKLFPEVFDHLVSNISTFKPEQEKLFSWIINQARNFMIEKISSRSFKITHPGSSDNNPQPEASNDYKPEQFAARELLNRMTPEQRHILECLYLKGNTVSEIAEMFHITESEVRSKVRGAMYILKTFHEIPLSSNQ
ncbi:MAG: RNA polymerase sigma factor [Cytophagaceae bacterium]